MITPWGSFVFKYDALNRMTSVSNPYGQTVSFGYDAAGRRTSRNMPNGTLTSIAYDAAGQVTQIVHQRTADHTAVAFANYSYDAAGDRTSMADINGTNVYGYDNLHRLVSASHPDMVTEAFNYDGVGNRTSDAMMSGYQYDVANRLTQNSSFTYTYDADGNLSVKRNMTTGAQTSFAYNSLNELAQATTSNLNISYQYDALDDLVGESLNGTAYQYIYDGNRILAVLDGSNNLVSLFTDGPGPAEPLIMRRNGADYFYHADAVGSIVALTDSNGNVVESYEYAAFGWPKVKDGQGNVEGWQSAVGNQSLFTGAEWNPETRLYHMGARHLDPSTGRWTQEDPLQTNIEAINLLKQMTENQAGTSGPIFQSYAYAENNPLLIADPLGLYGTTDCSYYVFQMILSAGENDWTKVHYYELAYFVCTTTPQNPTDNCFRKCLQDADVTAPLNCAGATQPSQVQCPAKNTSGGFLGCELSAHISCFQQCTVGPLTENE
jgi:RHS repeat-associated protein